MELREPKMQGITGIYSVELKPAGEQEMIFTPFFQLPELYSHMPENKAEGIIERAKKRFTKKVVNFRKTSIVCTKIECQQYPLFIRNGYGCS